MKAIFVNLICINWTPVYLRTQKLIPKRSWLDKFHCSNIYPWHQPTHCHSATSITYLPMAPAHTMPLSYQYSSPSYHFFIHFYIHFLLVIFMLLPNLKLEWVIIQLMTFDEVITRIDQPMEHDIHRGYPRWISCSMGWSILVFTEIESH